MIEVFLGFTGVLVLGALVPGPWRTPARVALAFHVILLPVWAAAYGISRLPQPGPGAWLLLVPLTFVWLVILDLRFGVGARLSRRPAAASNGRRAGAPNEDAQRTT